MIDAAQALIAALQAKAPRLSPWQRGKGRKPKKYLLAPRHRAHVVATRFQSAFFPNGCYSVDRDGVRTHLIARGPAGWFVKVIGRNGMSQPYPSAEFAAQQYGLVIHKWAHR